MKPKPANKIQGNDFKFQVTCKNSGTFDKNTIVQCITIQDTSLLSNFEQTVGETCFTPKNIFTTLLKTKLVVFLTVVRFVTDMAESNAGSVWDKPS